MPSFRPHLVFFHSCLTGSYFLCPPPCLLLPLSHLSSLRFTCSTHLLPHLSSSFPLSSPSLRYAVSVALTDPCLLFPCLFSPHYTFYSSVFSCVLFPDRASCCLFSPQSRFSFLLFSLSPSLTSPHLSHPRRSTLVSPSAAPCSSSSDPDVLAVMSRFRAAATTATASPRLASSGVIKADCTHG